MHQPANRMRKRTLRMRGSNRIACAACYLIAFLIPLAWEWAAIRLMFPWKLASTAPDVTAHLLKAFPVLDRWLSPVSLPASADASSFRALLAAREETWLRFLAFSALGAWLITLLIQLLWRMAHCRAVCCARQTLRAIRSYRLTMLLVWLLNAAAAAGVWFFGVQHITGRTLWDYLVSFGIYLLNPLAAIMVSRLAASPAISGKHAFFKRL